eukprot:8448447-Pyramimonas_sp.AAC.1
MATWSIFAQAHLHYGVPEASRPDEPSLNSDGYVHHDLVQRLGRDGGDGCALSVYEPQVVMGSIRARNLPEGRPTSRPWEWMLPGRC